MDSHTTVIDAYSTFLLLSYSKFATISFTLLMPTTSEIFLSKHIYTHSHKQIQRFILASFPNLPEAMECLCFGEPVTDYEITK